MTHVSESERIPGGLQQEGQWLLPWEGPWLLRWEVHGVTEQAQPRLMAEDSCRICGTFDK